MNNSNGTKKSKPAQGNLKPQGIDLHYGKVPPHASDLETAVLGACMLEPDAIDTAMEYLKPECFYVTQHQQLFDVMISMRNNRRPVDMMNLTKELEKQQLLQQIGGPFFVTSLTNHVVSAANVEDHARIIKQMFIYRQMIQFAGTVIHDAYEQSVDAFDMMDKAGEFVNGLATASFTQTGEKLETLMIRSVQRIATIQQRLAENPDDYLTGVPSGYPALDHVTYGWQPTDLIILAARPSVGKTALALNLARNAVRHPVRPTKVGVFSLEMDALKVTNRIVSAESAIELDLIEKGTISEAQLSLLYNNGIQPLMEAGLWIDDTPALGLLEFRAKARKWVKKFGVGLIIIDYIQLMTVGSLNDGAKRNREQEISLISRTIKATAKELKVPIIALSQLSRDVEKQKREPQLSDLRESGAIEQDADLVMFLTRGDYQQTEAEADPMLKDTAIGFIRKHRNGKLDNIQFRTRLDIQRWFGIREYEEYMKNLDQQLYF